MSAKLVPCKSCGKEVAKGAKVCPHCGAKLKMGFMMKLGIVVVGLVVIGVIARPSKEDINKELAQVEQAAPADLQAGGDLASMFSIMSDFTDIQREQKEKEITGLIIDWSLPVFDVSKKGDDPKMYRVQTSSEPDAVGSFIDLYPRDDNEATQIESLKTGDMVHFKGKIDGIAAFRNIDIAHARLVN